MIARAIMFSAVATLAMSCTASARPLLLSDLPADVRGLPNAQAGAPPAGHSIQPGWQQEGVASWYGADHAGRRTTSGARFNPRALTAAHATLPIGTRLLVVREDTGASVVVTINDRIGNHRRVIDLSRGAAEVIGLLRAGTAQVRLVPDGEGVMVPAPAFAPASDSALDGDDQAAAESTPVRHRRGVRRAAHAHAPAAFHVIRVRADSRPHPAARARRRT